VTDTRNDTHDKNTKGVSDSHCQSDGYEVFLDYYNGESERQREEMRWCRCYEDKEMKIEDVKVPHTLG
jgi:hypothetical protein